MLRSAQFSHDCLRRFHRPRRHIHGIGTCFSSVHSYWDWDYSQFQRVPLNDRHQHRRARLFSICACDGSSIAMDRHRCHYLRARRRLRPCVCMIPPRLVTLYIVCLFALYTISDSTLPCIFMTIYYDLCNEHLYHRLLARC